MCFPIDLIEQSCAFVLINEFNTFSYCCKACSRQFVSGTDLEQHILFGHADVKVETTTVFTTDGIFELTTSSASAEINPKTEPNAEEPPATETFQLPENVLTVESIAKSEENSLSDINNFDDLNVNNEDDYDNDGVNDDDVNDSTWGEVKPKKRGRPRKSENSVQLKRAVNSKKTVNFINAEPTEDEKKPRKYTKSQKTTARKKAKKKQEPKEKCYCDMCPDTSFSCKRNLRKHMIKHKQSSFKIKRCEICNKMPKDYEKHMRMNHMEEKPYKCDICDARYKTQENLNCHVRMHTGERPYLCSYCGISFASASGKYKHETIVHTKIKRYSCSECDRSFKHPSELRDHRYSFHSFERPYTCEICSNSFSTRKYLYQHKRVHGEKINQCRYCEKKFRLGENRRKHEKQVHKAV